MSRRKPLAALAAVTAALALALPAANAGAEPTPAARVLIGTGLLPSGSPPCYFLINQVRFALLTGNTAAANFWSNVFLYSGCGGAAI